MLNNIRDHRQVSAQVHHSGQDEIALQIELPNDMAVLLTVSCEDGARVSLWRGSGERGFEGTTVEAFREWLAEASFGQGPDIDVQSAEDEKVIALLFEAPRSPEELGAITNWPLVYLQGVFYRLLHHWNFPVIEPRDGLYQLTEFGRGFHELRMRSSE